MASDTDEQPPPCSTDLDGWRQAVADGRFREFRMEAIIAAIQDLGPDTESSVMNALVLHASDSILRILRKRVSKKSGNDREDVIEEAHALLIEAIFKPNSADGKGLRKAFVPRIEFRLVDALRKVQTRKTRERVTDIERSPIVETVSRDIDPCRDWDEKLDVELVLGRVTDERKRLAFRLYMEDIPIESKKSASIATALGVSSKTAGQWIDEVRAQLRNSMGERP